MALSVTLHPRDAHARSADVRAAAIEQVLVDVGHRPETPGVIGAAGTREHDLNRRLASAVVRRLLARGVQARISGGGDGEGATEPAPRAATARESAEQLAARTRDTSPASLLLSVHHDSMPQSWIDEGRAREHRGFALFVSASGRGARASLRCARAIGRALRAIGEKPSRYHAQPVAGENRPFLSAADGVHRFDELVVLRTSRGPAVLLEAGVLANPDEEARLADPRVAERMADAVARGVARCARSR